MPQTYDSVIFQSALGKLVGDPAQQEAEYKKAVSSPDSPLLRELQGAPVVGKPTVGGTRVPLEPTPFGGEGLLNAGNALAAAAEKLPGIGHLMDVAGYVSPVEAAPAPDQGMPFYNVASPVADFGRQMVTGALTGWNPAAIAGDVVAKQVHEEAIKDVRAGKPVEKLYNLLQGVGIAPTGKFADTEEERARSTGYDQFLKVFSPVEAAATVWGIGRATRYLYNLGQASPKGASLALKKLGVYVGAPTVQAIIDLKMHGVNPTLTDPETGYERPNPEFYKSILTSSLANVVGLGLGKAGVWPFGEKPPAKPLATETSPQAQKSMLEQVMKATPEEEALFFGNRDIYNTKEPIPALTRGAIVSGDVGDKPFYKVVKPVIREGLGAEMAGKRITTPIKLQRVVLPHDLSEPWNAQGQDFQTTDIGRVLPDKTKEWTPQQTKMWNDAQNTAIKNIEILNENLGAKITPENRAFLDTFRRGQFVKLAELHDLTSLNRAYGLDIGDVVNTGDLSKPGVITKLDPFGTVEVDGKRVDIKNIKGRFDVVNPGEAPTYLPYDGNKAYNVATNAISEGVVDPDNGAAMALYARDFDPRLVSPTVTHSNETLSQLAKMGATVETNPTLGGETLAGGELSSKLLQPSLASGEVQGDVNLPISVEFFQAGGKPTKEMFEKMWQLAGEKGTVISGDPAFLRIGFKNPDSAIKLMEAFRTPAPKSAATSKGPWPIGENVLPVQPAALGGVTIGGGKTPPPANPKQGGGAPPTAPTTGEGEGGGGSGPKAGAPKYSYAGRYFVDSAYNIINALQKADKGGVLAARDTLNKFLTLNGSETSGEHFAKRDAATIFQGMSSQQRANAGSMAVALSAEQIDALKGVGKVVHPGGKTGAELVQELEQRLGPQEAALARQKAGEVFAAMRKNVVDALYNEPSGKLITDEEYNKLTQRDWVPRIDTKYIRDTFDRQVSESAKAITAGGVDTSILQMEHGTKNPLISDPEKLLAYAYSRAKRAVWKQRATRELASLDGSVDWISHSPKPGWDEITYLNENAEPTKMYAPQELAREWATADPQILSTPARLFRTYSLRDARAGIISKYNPLFPLTNFPLDSLTIIAGQPEYKSLAGGGLRYVSDVAHVFKQAFQRKGLYYDGFVEHGGEFGFLSDHPLREKLISENVTDKVKDVLQLMNHRFELVPRLALMRRAMLNGKSMEEAVAIARNQLDFSRSGTVSQGIDTIFPFFNAGIQATRGVASGLVRDPHVALWKTGEALAFGAGLAYMQYAMFPQVMQQIPKNVRDNNFIIPLSDVPKKYDEDGNPVYNYIAIRKDPLSEAIGYITSWAVRKQLGYNDTTEEAGALDALHKVAGLATGGFRGVAGQPLISALMGAYFNKNLFTGGEVYYSGGGELPTEKKYLESNSSTLPIYTAMAEKLHEVGVEGVSPARLQFLGQEMFPESTALGSAFGWGMRLMGGQESGFDPASHIPAVSNLVKETKPQWKANELAKKFEGLSRADTVERRQAVDRVLKIDQAAEDGRYTNTLAYINSLDDPDAMQYGFTRLAKAITKSEPAGSMIPILEANTMSPVRKAEAFWEYYHIQPPGEREEVYRNLMSSSLMSSAQFVARLTELGIQ